MHAEPLRDMRHGDADDDRTSPHGRGWRKLIVSSALEFNYLTASLVFLGLFIVPALLVGIAPLLVLEHGRGKLALISQLTTRPVAALAWLGVSVAVLVWIARPLISRAIDYFWHLHYTLVCPMFVGLRELLAALAERLPGVTMTPEQIDRRRRLGTVLATIVFAGLCLLLARSIQFSNGPALYALRGSPLTLSAAVIGNAVVILSLTTVIASLIWLIREVTSRRPVLDWMPESQSGTSRTATARVAHLSDLHLVAERYGYRMECGTAGPQGNGRIRETLRRLSAIDAVAPLDHIVVTGDVTDAGTRAEWASFLDLLRRYPSLRTRVLFVPGNHDVNVIDRSNPGRFALPWSEGEALRKLRVVLTLDELHGDAVHLVNVKTGTPGQSLREYLRQGDRAQHLDSLGERASWRGRAEMMKVWEEIWPLVLPPANGGFGVILLDSNARRHISLTNAVGFIGRRQLKAMKSVLRTARDRAWMVLLHHQVAEYPVPSIGLQERIGLALVNAPDVLNAIAAHGAPVVVLHGHRHWDWIGTRGDVVLCSAPSASMGSNNIDKTHGSFHIYELAVSPGGGLQLMTSERITVS